MRIKKYILLFVISLLFYNVTYGQEVCDSVKIYFRQGYCNLDLTIGNNKVALDRIADSLATSYADSIYKLKAITIIGGASPEGSIELNKRLSEKRANVLFDYLSQYGELPVSSKNFVYLGRDWNGLLALVRDDENVPYRDEVIEMLEDIITKSADGELLSDNNVGRLLNFRDGEPYRYMYKFLFPDLRASRMILNYEKIRNPICIAPIEYKANLMAPALEVPELMLQPAPIDSVMSRRPFYMAVKTDLINDLFMIPKLGIEFYLSNNYTLAVNWMYGWWKNDGRKWYHRAYGGDIAIRKWLGRKAKEKPLTGHHLGLYGQVFTSDFLWGDIGHMAGEPGGNIFDRANFAIGMEYGYSLPVARRLNIDFSLGMGYMWGKYYEYTPIDNCYVWQATKNRKWFGPTKAEVSLVWLIGRDNVNAKKGGRQ